MIMKVRLLMALALLTLSAQGAIAKTKKTAKTPAEQSAEMVFRIKKGYDITVDSYDPKTKTFSITINSERAVGPNFADPEPLREAIEYEGNLKHFMRKKDQLIGSIFQLKKDLVLVSEKEMLKRMSRKNKSK